MYKFRAGFIRVTGKHTVHIAQYDKKFRLHHTCHKTAQFIVIGKHKFLYRYGVILIYHRYHAVVQHGCHTTHLVGIECLIHKVLLCGKNLANSYAVLLEQLIVMVNELGLADSRKQLASGYALILEARQCATARCHGTG